MKRQAATELGADDAIPEEGAPRSLPAEGAALLERVRQNPADDEAWDQLDEIARSSDRPDEVSLLYRETLARDLSAGAGAPAGMRARRFPREPFEDPSLVRHILPRLLSLD